ncbi:MAG: class I SAM-dependent methyltransferase, partial [Leadbetterella sp.]
MGKKHFEYFQNLAEKFDKKRKRHSYYWDSVTQYFSYFAHEDYSVLEIGSATGELLNALPGSRKVGIDFSPKMVQIATEKYPNLEFHTMDAEDIQLDEKFDLIVISNLVEQLEDVQAVFEQLRKVSHSYTKVVVHYYNFLWEPILKLSEKIGLKTYVPNPNWLSKYDVENLLYLAGFDVYRTTIKTPLP